MKDSDFVVAGIVGHALSSMCARQRDGKLKGKTGFAVCISGFTEQQKESAMMAIEACGFICSYDQYRITISLSN